MSVIAELRIPATDFELGRILNLSNGASVELETLVPAGERAVPFLWVYGVDTEAFAARLDAEPSVEEIEIVEAFDSQALYGLDWNAADDLLLTTIRDQCGQIVRATGSGEEWRFELRFPDHDAMSTFRRRCEDAGATITVARVYHPTGPDARARFGLTEHQHEALTLAVEMGYYDVPRRCTTVEVASELGISDQALTERLRRGISALAENTVFAQTNATAAD
ncbi:Predicted DNA binding protein, contains HTH domain [Natronoarchaeum philippinense]|uniref:Predicted DNA binding protein, contains HTH domain n=1 Tax=Natronoarchaeum philippinense TaxID=558529 RepID=A0A285P3I5_NATPI|nr:helix-turn-helix domain-containing protein [Natronoarchaeum philippinense]SNZ15817.1 Predicted DNA binding protein, contains HTH domain [Natronoarchaeum philippinense]